MDKPKSGSLEDLIAAAQNNENPDFWDNLIGGILNRMVGTGQRWSKVADALNLPKELRPDGGKMTTEDWTNVAKKLRPTEGWGGVVGDVVATAPLMALPGGPIAGGVALGALTALTEPVRGEESLGTLVSRTGVSAGIGGAFGILGKLVGGPARHSPERFNREVMQAAAPPGTRVTRIGREGVEELQQAWTAAYDAVTPRLRVQADNDLLNDLVAVLGAIPGSGAPADVGSRVQAVIDNNIIDVLAANNGRLSGDAVNRVQSTLREVAERQPDLEVPINAVRDAFLTAVERASPDAAAELRQLRTQYPAFIAVQKTVAKPTTKEGVFTPDQLAAAITATDTSAHKGATASGRRPFQELVDEARRNNIGKVGALGRLVPIIGRASRIVEESPVLSGIGATIEGATVPVTAAVTAQTNRQQLPGAAEEPIPVAPQVGDPAPLSGGIGLQDTSDDADMERFLREPISGAAGPEDDDADMEQFLRGPLEGAGRAILPGQEDDDFDKEAQPLLQGGRKASLLNGLYAAIEMQESSGRGARTPTSVNGARGPMQIMPGTWRQYAKPGENIDNPEHNRRVGHRIIDDLYNKYGDPRAVAAAYFSGKPNWRSSAADGNGKKTSDYAQNIMKRLEAQGLSI